MIVATSYPDYDRMSETSFLEGKVLKRSLPVFHGAPPVDAMGSKRLLLPQGELAQLYDGAEGIRYLACVELRTGGIRGNHFHRAKEEFVYVISGELLLLAQDGREGARVSIRCQAGDLAMIATGIPHAIQTIEPGYAIEFSKTQFDATDVERFTLI